MEAHQAIEDAINIAIRDKLWEQHDVRPSIKDYGRILLMISFEFPPNKGEFTVFVPVTDAEHLRPFLSKLWIWMQAVKNTARDTPQTGSATKPAASSS
ncbi:MAG: hypothetical protein HZA50_03240 [Planctomycetes bacterium]|nr:hypothetical protein [Planctomycetota bacterium]